MGWGSAITVGSFVLTAALLATFVAIETALAFLPAGLLVAFGAPRLGPLVDRFGTAKLIAAGVAALVSGYVLFLRLGDDPSFLGLMLLLGAGFALMFPSLNIQATAGVADHEQGLASGLLNTSFQVGGAVGLAAVSAVVSSSGAVPTLDGFQSAIGVPIVLGAIGVVVAATAFLAPARERLLARAES